LNKRDEQRMLADDIRQLTTGASNEQTISWITPPAQPAAEASTAVSSTGGGQSSWLNWALQPVSQMLGSPTSAMTGGTRQSLLSGLSGMFSPVLGGLISLFSGGGPSAPPTPVKFTMPPAQHLQLGFSSAAGGGFVGANEAASGASRAQTTGTAAAGQGPASAGQQVVVQVQAMDGQSIIDRRRDIADAVRLALLESHQLNDLISNSE